MFDYFLLKKNFKREIGKWVNGKLTATKISDFDVEDFER